MDRLIIDHLRSCQNYPNAQIVVQIQSLKKRPKPLVGAKSFVIPFTLSVPILFAHWQHSIKEQELMLSMSSPNKYSKTSKKSQEVEALVQDKAIA